MSIPKLFFLITLVLFGTIGVLSVVKKNRAQKQQEVFSTDPYELAVSLPAEQEKLPAAPEEKPKAPAKVEEVRVSAESLPEVDRIDELFHVYEPKLPIVETIAYKSKVDWQPGRAAWISDYARHYETSRHFIARSLNGKPEYFQQNVSSGDRFNVFRKDKPIEFHLLVDVDSSKMWLYYYDVEANERVMLKSYPVGLGRADKSRASGLLTPLGTYSLGTKVAIYKPKSYGYHNGEKVEMIRIFGTRWIPFDQELADNTAPSKGLGVHGLPWKEGKNGELVEERDSLGKYQSDGCIRLQTDDMEEIFAVIITKPSFIHLVKGFNESGLPGKAK